MTIQGSIPETVVNTNLNKERHVEMLKAEIAVELTNTWGKDYQISYQMFMRQAAQEEVIL